MYVTINGTRLNVKLLGSELVDRPVMIAHHGAPGLGSMAEPDAAFARFAHELPLLVFDARGSGRSDGEPPFSHAQWADDIEGLRVWSGAEKVVVAGGSYGGFIAMEYAINYPDRVQALILRDTTADNTHMDLALRNAMKSSRVTIDRAKFDRIVSGTVKDDADLADCWREILPLYDHDYNPEAIEQRAKATPYRYRTHNYAFSVLHKNYDIRDRLPQITCPTLVTVGRHDWITPVECSEAIAELIPNSELVIFENSGHSPQVEEYDRFSSVVHQFLRAHT